MPNVFIEEVLKLALTQDGVRENRDASGHPNNRGKQVEEYLAAVGLGPGDPYCAAFIYWAIKSTAKKLGVSTVPFIFTGYCPDIYTWAKSRNLIVTHPQRGDAFLVQRLYEDGKVWSSHIGLVVDVDEKAGTFTTIEGNTNAALSNEGDGVHRKTRRISSKIVFVRWGSLVPEKIDGPTPTYDLVINGKHLLDMPVKEGHSLCPARAWGDYWKLTTTWDADYQVIELNGKAVPAQVTIIEGKGYVPVTSLVTGTKLKMDVDNKARKVLITGTLS